MASEDRHRIVVLGAGKVGKTSFVGRFLNGGFPGAYKATVEDLHCRDYDINGTIIKVDVLDTSGELVFPAMRRLSISTGHAFVLMFAINKPETFHRACALWEEIRECRTGWAELPVALVANKCDLMTRPDLRRQCDDLMHEAEMWSHSNNLAGKFLQTSAMDDTGIGAVFRRLLDQADIPAVRELEPILKRRLSANAAQNRTRKLREEAEGKIGRSRSLIRRATKPKVKHTGDPNRNDCILS